MKKKKMLNGKREKMRRNCLAKVIKEEGKKKGIWEVDKVEFNWFSKGHERNEDSDIYLWQS